MAPPAAHLQHCGPVFSCNVVSLEVYKPRKDFMVVCVAPPHSFKTTAFRVESIVYIKLSFTWSLLITEQTPDLEIQFHEKGKIISKSLVSLRALLAVDFQGCHETGLCLKVPVQKAKKFKDVGLLTMNVWYSNGVRGQRPSAWEAVYDHPMAYILSKSIAVQVNCAYDIRSKQNSVYLSLEHGPYRFRTPSAAKSNERVEWKETYCWPAVITLVSQDIVLRLYDSRGPIGEGYVRLNKLSGTDFEKHRQAGLKVIVPVTDNKAREVASVMLFVMSTGNRGASLVWKGEDQDAEEESQVLQAAQTRLESICDTIENLLEELAAAERQLVNLPVDETKRRAHLARSEHYARTVAHQHAMAVEERRHVERRGDAMELMMILRKDGSEEDLKMAGRLDKAMEEEYYSSERVAVVAKRVHDFLKSCSASEFKNHEIKFKEMSKEFTELAEAHFIFSCKFADLLRFAKGEKAVPSQSLRSEGLFRSPAAVDLKALARNEEPSVYDPFSGTGPAMKRTTPKAPAGANTIALLSRSEHQKFSSPPLEGRSGGLGAGAPRDLLSAVKVLKMDDEEEEDGKEAA
mmetsp:Transcript_2209/g.3347  ORF Transcript_2209/g.3347 Transcript_2209/m.3347 type:complete len:574 (+) Transcript_2209:145-1866(+)